MATLPEKIKSRKPQNARLGIKSSLSNLKRVVSLVYLLYLANDRKGKIDYSEEYTVGGSTKIRLKDNYKAFVSNLFSPAEADSVIGENPLITSQLEPLQVGLELVFQLGKISFVAKKASSAERTGGNRYAKSITFSKNIIYLDVYLSALSENDRNAVLAAWMKNSISGTDSDAALYRILASFTENLKMSVYNGTENRIFEQEGLYKELLAGNTVVGKDAHEDVGPLRIYKSFVKENMHPYVSCANNEFALKGDINELQNYLTLVSTSLDLLCSEIQEAAPAEDNDNGNAILPTETIQKIYYGCPGTGKSYKVMSETEGEDGKKTVYFDKHGIYVPDIEAIEDKSEHTTNIFRTTFHPDYDYSTFVGSYKPVMNPILDEDGNVTDKEELGYEFVPQVFTNAYVRAWKSLNDENIPDEKKHVYLIIEEINRGNCAQIFGDLFQLLDRRKDGRSEYFIVPDAELRKYLAKHNLECNKLILPENLHILATMNTSDQSLFPMDSAFKRRWAMEYIPVNLKHDIAKNYSFKVNGIEYSWVEFLSKVNPLIRKATDSEDKQMGEFFIKGNITEEDFKNKVMFYIWNDVCKDLYSASRISPFYFMRSDVGEDPKHVFTFAELFGAGRFDKDDNDYTSPSALIEGFITKQLDLKAIGNA